MESRRGAQWPTSEAVTTRLSERNMSRQQVTTHQGTYGISSSQRSVPWHTFGYSEFRSRHGSDTITPAYGVSPHITPQLLHAQNFEPIQGISDAQYAYNTTGKAFFDRRMSVQRSPPSLVASGSSIASSSSDFSLDTSPPNTDFQTRALSLADHQQSQIKQQTSPDWTQISDNQISDTPYDPFSPPVFTAPFSTQRPGFSRQKAFSSSARSRQLSDYDALPSSSMDMSPKSKPRAQQRTAPLAQDVRKEPTGSAFESYMRSEINRRNVAAKTINSIRSAQARAVAQTKEDTRRVEWAKGVVVKFPEECALSDGLTSGSMFGDIPAFGQSRR